jgi:hypothetical protein
MSIDVINGLFRKTDRYFRFFGFSILGVKAEENPEKVQDKLKHAIKVTGFWYYVIGLSFMIISNIVHDMIYFEEQNHEKMIYFVNIPFSILKIFVIFTNRKIIFDIIEDFRKIYKNAVINDKQLKGLKNYIKIFETATVGRMLVFTIKMIMAIVIQHGINKIALPMWTPTQNGIIVNISSLYFGIANPMALFASEVTISIITTLIAVSFDNLNTKILTLNDTKESDKPKVMKELIEYQLKLFEIFQKFENYFSSIFFILFAQSSISLCLAGFEIITVDKVIDMIMNSSFLVLTLLQIFSACYFGQKIIDSSQKTAEAAYEINWYCMTDIKLKKAVLLMLLRSQKLQQITAKGIAIISLATFTHVSS